MALNNMIRRATSTVIPLAVRSVRSPRSFNGAISAAVSLDRVSLGHELNRGVVSYLRFSTAATAKKASSDENLLSVVESEIQCAESEETPNRDVLEDMPEGFPFEIQDTPGERTVLLKREFEDEKIQVQVDMLASFGEEEEENADEDAGDRTQIPMVVNVCKANGLCLEFGVSALPDEIVIDSLSIKRPEGSDDQLAYEGPDFDDLDENLQKAFHKYLEVRGIKPSITSFLIEYMENKDSREYLQWLKDLKSFVQKGN